MNSDRAVNNKVVNNIPKHYLLKKQTPKLKRKIAARQVALDRINQSGTRSLNSNLLGIALSGTASVEYDDNGSAASATTYDADLYIVGTAGATTVTIGMDVDAGATITGVDMATEVGPVTIAADMHDSSPDSTADNGEGNPVRNEDERRVTVSLDAPIGDATIGLDNSGDVTVSGTWGEITLTHTVKDGADSTAGSFSIAGMNVSLSNDGGDTTWTIGTTLSGVALALSSLGDVSAEFGLAGNMMTVSHVGDRASEIATVDATEVDAVHSKASEASFSTVSISRPLPSGATLSATYSTKDDSLTLKAAVAF